MNTLHGECRQTDRDILCAFRPGRTVLHPFATMRDDRLTGQNLDNTAFRSNQQFAAQHQGILVELGVCPGSTQPLGLFIRATLSSSVFELTRPMNSSMIFGLLPAA